MDFSRASEICAHLESALKAEDQLIKPSLRGQGEVSEADRKRAAETMRYLKVFYDLPSCVFFQSVHLLDKFLSKMKTVPRYLECISLSCFHMAVTGNRIPLNPADFISTSGASFSVNDLVKMETIIEQKLCLWENVIITSLDVLHIMYSLCLHAFQDKRDIWPNFENLTQILEILICDSRSVSFKGSRLALGLLFNEMEKPGCCDEIVMSWLKELQGFCQITNDELEQSKGFIVESIKDYFQTPCLSPQRKLIWKLSPRTLYSLRPSQRIREIMPTIQEVEFSEKSSSNGKEGFHADTLCLVSPKKHLSKNRQASYA